MAVTWDWRAKKGEVIWVKDDDPNVKFTWSIYEANCLAAFTKEFKDEETGKDMYEFMTFFGETHHMKRCLGLEKSYHLNEKSNCFNVYANFHVDYIRLDMNYKSNEILLRWFTKAGYECRTYIGGKDE